MQIHIGVWTHEQGTHVSAYRSAQGPEKCRQEIAQDNWDYEFPDEEKPADPADAADRYFELMGDRVESAERFEQCTITLED